MNDSFKMFIIALVTALASQLLLGPYILELQGYLPANEMVQQKQPVMAGGRLEQGARVVAPAAPASKLTAPNLEGMTVTAARERWRDKGLTIIEDGERVDSGAEPGAIIEQRPARGSPLASMEIRVTVAKATPEIDVPNVVGQPIAEARAALELAGFDVPDPMFETSRETKGSVLKQAPAPGSKVKAKSIVRLVVAEAASSMVPKVTGMYLPKARQMIEDAGLKMGAIRRVEHAERREDYVLRQDPEPDTEVLPGTEVGLVIVAPD